MGIPYPVLLGLLVFLLNLIPIIGSTIGGAILGIVGALIAIPVAAAIQLILEEVTFRRFGNS